MDSIIRLPGCGSSQVAILIDYAQSRSISVEALLCGSEITEDTLEQEDPTPNQELVVIQNMISSLSEHPFEIGLNVGRACHANSFGLFGLAFVASDSAEQIINLMTQFLSGEHHFVKINPHISDNKIITTFEVLDDLPERTAQFILGRDMGTSIALQKNVLIGLPQLTTEVGFMGPELPGMSQVGEQYGCEVKFQQPYNYLHSHLRALDLVLPMGNRLLSQMLSKRAGNYLDSKREEALLGQDMQERIASLLDLEGYVDINKEHIASKLNMSSRTLSRYLLREDTSWRGLTIKLRMNKAKALLETSTENLESIAFKIGFSSASAFSSAFSREIGKSPQEYRLTTAKADSTILAM